MFKKKKKMFHSIYLSVKNKWWCNPSFDLKNYHYNLELTWKGPGIWGEPCMQKLKGNENIDMYATLAYLKQQLNIENKYAWLMENKQTLINTVLFMRNYNFTQQETNKQKASFPSFIST